jgi:hypothetical protein
MLDDELDAISVPELRRRVDRAIAVVREMRRALAVQAGMTLEGAPGPIPEIDVEEGRARLEEMMATLPVLRRRLTAEERAKLRPVSAAQHEQMKEVLDELVANKDAYETLAEGGELPLSHEQVMKLRESFDKTDMMAELQREMQAYVEDLEAYRRALEERMAEATARMASKGEPPS